MTIRRFMQEKPAPIKLVRADGFVTGLIELFEFIILTSLMLRASLRKMIGGC